MHIFIHLVILFIFVFALLMINIPHIAYNEYIKFKLYIFVGIFIFEFIVNIVTAIFKRCLINISRIARNSLQSALIAVIAYSIYNDLVWSESPLLAGQDTNLIKNLTITVMIIAFIALGYFIEIAFTDRIPGINDCLNTIYQKK